MAKPSMYLFLCALHADGVSTLLLTPEDELTFEGVAVQRSHLEGIGDALIVAVRHGDGEIPVDAVRAVDQRNVCTVCRLADSHKVAVVIAIRQQGDV